MKTSIVILIAVSVIGVCLLAGALRLAITGFTPLIPVELCVKFGHLAPEGTEAEDAEVLRLRIEHKANAALVARTTSGVRTHVDSIDRGAWSYTVSSVSTCLNKFGTRKYYRTVAAYSPIAGGTWSLLSWSARTATVDEYMEAAEFEAWMSRFDMPQLRTMERVRMANDALRRVVEGK